MKYLMCILMLLSLISCAAKPAEDVREFSCPSVYLENRKAVKASFPYRIGFNVYQIEFTINFEPDIYEYSRSGSPTIFSQGKPGIGDNLWQVYFNNEELVFSSLIDGSRLGLIRATWHHNMQPKKDYHIKIIKGHQLHEWKFIVNGKEVKYSSYGSTRILPKYKGPFYIGRASSADSGYFHGWIKDLTIRWGD